MKKDVEVKLAEVQPKRTLENIQEEIRGLLFKSGQIQYSLCQLTKDQEMINNALKDLDKEGVMLKEAADAAKKEEPKSE